jgi:hypothetical protein
VARRRLGLAALASVLVLVGVPAPAGASAAGTVHLRGTAYEFNNVHTLLAGATIRVAEYPRRRAVVRPDGTYDLTVPDRARVTPYIVAPGYHTIYLQTFRTAGENLRNVNFQTPTDGVYRGLVALLGVPLDAAGDPAQCAIVSTFSTRNVRDRSFAGFIGYGAQGVAGACAPATPTLAPPIYFNESVLPDPAQTLSSRDGGVVWTRVPAGVYTIRAHHPSTRFASFVATCRPGRIVNANPPWGLHELGLPNRAHVAARWSVRGARAALRTLVATRLPDRARVTLRCRGPRCPFESRAVTPPAGAHRANLLPALGAAAGRLRAGQTLEATIRAPAHDGAVTRWRLRADRQPRMTRLCIPLGNTLPRRCG